MDVNEHEPRCCNGDPRWRTGRPPDLVPAVAPINPGRRPLDVWNPDPTIVRVINPSSVVVTRPGPWVIADPVPTAIGPFPMTVAIGPPPRFNTRGMPTTAVGGDIHPCAVRR